MIGDLRTIEERLARLESTLQRPTQEIRDEGALRLRWGRQPDGAWTVRAHAPGGAVIADLLGLGPVVTSLPAGPLPGQTVRYLGGLCIWEPHRNAGAGAWGVYGAPPIGAQQTASTTVVGNAAQAMTNGPTVAAPVTGLYLLEATGSVAMSNTPGGIVDWSVAIARAGVGIVDAGRGTLANAAWAGRHTVYRRPYAPFLFTAGQVLSLRVQASAAAADMRYGDYTPWQVAMTPIELRP